MRVLADVEVYQDLQGPPIEEDANFLCNVAFYMHFDCSVDSEPTPFQAICASSIAIFADDTSL